MLAINQYMYKHSLSSCNELYCVLDAIREVKYALYYFYIP